MKTFIVHHRSPHHAIKSGYSRLADYLPMTGRVEGNTKFPYTLAKLISQRMNQSAGNYDSSSLLKEIELYGLLRKRNDETRIIHYLNAERDIRYLAQFKQNFKNTFFCGTFHKPPEILKKQITIPEYVKQLDGAIAVGINQVNFLKDWLNTEYVQYIPHGVDTQFFYPDIHKKQGQRILFVGQYLRDFKTFNKSIAVVLKRFPHIKVDVVLRTEFIKFIDNHLQIKIHSGIDDLILRELYQKATLLFLPLINATACNSILEALACGLPIVTSDVGGISEYLNGSENIFVPPSDSDSFIEVISDLLKDEKRLNLMGESSRVKALEYDWEIVSNKVVEFYKLIQE